ncbi:MAG TPA: ACT domain-containing protein [Holophaga sp.]|nr:ACT domain-containing protein [Holophaga sp.]
MDGAVSDPGQLLRGLRPVLHPGVQVFATVPRREDAEGLAFLASFQEEEGLTLVLEEGEAARAGLEPLFRAAWITLTVHSALEAVGLTAAVAAALARESIACNVIAAARHDHLFVPVDRAQDALRVLAGLAEGAGTDG